MARTRRNIAIIFTILLGLLVLTTLLYGPALFGAALLARLPESYDVRAARIGGPLWRPVLTDVTIDAPGLNATAKRLAVSPRSVDLSGQVVKFAASVHGARADIDPKELLSGERRSEWLFLPAELDLHDVQARVDGQGYQLPDAELGVRSDGDRLKLTARTTHGELNADVQYALEGDDLTAAANLTADATLINLVWPGIEGGTIAGTYTYDGRGVHGDLTIEGGTLRLPEAPQVTVTDVRGTLTHRGDLIDTRLAGRAYDGPIEADATVDLAKPEWTVRATARPDLAVAADAFGQDATGRATIQATASGWDNPTVNAEVNGEGTIAGQPVEKLTGTYVLDDRISTVDVSAELRLLNERQALRVKWTPNLSGAASLTGQLLQQPLDLTATLNGSDLTVQGDALGGTQDVQLNTRTRAVSAALQATVQQVTLRTRVSGTTDRARLDIQQLQAGPLDLSGTGVAGRDGIALDLGQLTVNLDPKLRGDWTVGGLSAYGVTLRGSGTVDVPASTLLGRLSARHPTLDAPLAGPVALDWRERRATWDTPEAQLGWAGTDFTAALNGLTAHGVRANGDLAYRAGELTGDLRLDGHGSRLNVAARGGTLTATGDVRGIPVEGNGDLQERTLSARVPGQDIRVDARLAGTPSFTVRTGGEQLTGTYEGGALDARGRVNLTALRELANTPDLTGTLDVDVTDGRGDLRATASAAGADLNAALRLNGTRLSGNVNAVAQGAALDVTGPLYPTAAARGTLTWQDQQVRVAVTGAPSDLRMRAQGVTAPIGAGGVVLPGQPLDVTARLQPTPSAQGNWGDLRVAYDTNGLRVEGAQTLTVAGEDARVQLRGRLGENWAGEVTASGRIADHDLTVRGPWDALRATVSGPRARGTLRASVPARTGTIDLRLPSEGLHARGDAALTDDGPRANLALSDGSGGTARVRVQSAQDWQASLNSLQVRGQQVDGTLSAASGLLSGDVRAAGLSIQADAGRVRATGSFAGTDVNASGTVRLPAQLSDVQVNLRGEWGDATLSGDGTDLAGRVSIHEIRRDASGVTFVVPATTLPVRADLAALTARVGGVTYADGVLSGQQALPYALAGQAGTATVSAENGVIRADLNGPLQGDLRVVPRVAGTVRVSEAALGVILDQLTAKQDELGPVLNELKSGTLLVAVDGEQAQLNLEGARWAGAPLGLQAEASWAKGVRASGLITHPGTRVPVRLEGNTLTLNDAVIDARALAPLLPDAADGLTGALRGDLRMPDLDVQRARADLRVQLSQPDRDVSGRVTLRDGQVRADLDGTIDGLNARLSGQLYPTANARLTLDDLTATVRGELPDRLTARVNGSVRGRDISGTAELQGEQLTARALSDGITATLDAQRGTGGWAGTVNVDAPDLSALTGQSGAASAALSGTLQSASGTVTGTAAGVDFRVPLVWSDGRLGTRDASVIARQGSVALTGQLLPELDLRGEANVTETAPGAYTLTIDGPLRKPDVRAQGALSGPIDLNGAQVALSGTRVDARLLGNDWRLNLAGDALSGTARGNASRLILADLRADTRVRTASGTIALRGPLAWNARTGWTGDLNATGEISGEPIDLRLGGAASGALTAQGVVATGNVRAELGRDLPLVPAGHVRLRAVDVAALWGKPGEVTVTGNATLGGSDWANLGGAVDGEITDTAGELTGRITGTYDLKGARVRVLTERLNADVTVKPDGVLAEVNARDVNVARLLPDTYELTALRATGRADVRVASGETPVVRLTDLNVQGRHVTAGRIDLRGSGTYDERSIGAELTGQVGDGRVRASGSLPDGLRVELSDFAVPGRDVGRVSGDVTLSGRAGNPGVNGTVALRRPDAVIDATVGGRLNDLQADYRARLNGAAEGRLTGTLEGTVRAPDLDVERLTLTARGEVQADDARVGLDVRGTWPKLAGTITARVPGLDAPISARGDGRGTYRVDLGDLGAGTVTLEGLVPTVRAEATLTPLPLLDAAGTGELRVTAAGPLTDLRLTASGALLGVERAGVRVEQLLVSGAGSATDMTLDLRQGERSVGTVNLKGAVLNGLQVSTAQADLTVAGTVRYADGQPVADLTVNADGTIDGDARLTYRTGQVSVRGNARAYGVTIDADARGTTEGGWSGRVNLSDLPENVTGGSARLALSGPWDAPRLTGTAELIGATAALDAGADGVQLQLTDGPDTRASGTLRAGTGGVNGDATLQRGPVKVELSARGTLDQPLLDLRATSGEWRASGTLDANGGRLTVTDGQREGLVAVTRERVSVDVPGLDVARLQLADLQGTVSAQGAYDLRARQGRMNVALRDGRTPLVLPVLELPVEGNVNASVELDGARVRVSGRAVTSQGTIDAQAALDGTWTARVQGNLRRDGGKFLADLNLKRGAVAGTLTAEQYPLQLLGVAEPLDGTVTLDGENFTARATLEGPLGRVSVDGSGHIGAALADFDLPIELPKAGEDDTYRLDARLEGLDLQRLKLAEHLSGRVSGSATLSDGGSTFILRSTDLTVAGQTLGSRVEGTSFGSEWRVRGNIGDSQLFGNVTDGVLRGRLQLTALPVGSLLGAFSGPLPGKGTITGLARLEIPLADPLSGKVDVAAERVRVSSGKETLSGAGSLRYENRELRQVQVSLSGSGSWDVRGQYTREKVDLKAALRGTTFTPVLSLIPSLSDLGPTLTGDVEALVGGTYARPKATFTARDLRGAVRDVRVNIPTLTGQLDDGQFSANADVRLAGQIAATGRLTATGQADGTGLRGTLVRYEGDLASRETGRFERVQLELTQAQATDRWDVQGTVTQSGTAILTGTVAPDINLTLVARELTPQLGFVYGRESNLSGTLTLREDRRDYVVDGALTFERLVLGSVTAPEGLDRIKRDPNALTTGSFASPLPAELTTFPTPDAERTVSPLLSRIRLDDIPLIFPNGIRINENLVRAEMTGALLLSGRASDPRVTGSISVVRGTVFLRENEFSVREGRAVFDGTSAYPEVTLRSVGTVNADQQRLNVSLRLDGTFEPDASGLRSLRLDPVLACEAPSSGELCNPTDLYALVAFGTPASRLTGAAQELTASALRTALNVFIVGELERNLAKALGLDVLRIRTNLLSGDSDFKVQFTLGGYVSREFYVQYEVDLTGKGVFDATYQAPDSPLSVRVSSPLTGLNLSSLQPKIGIGYALNQKSGLNFEVSSGQSTGFRFGYTLKY